MEEWPWPFASRAKQTVTCNAVGATSALVDDQVKPFAAGSPSVPLSSPPPIASQPALPLDSAYRFKMFPPEFVSATKLAETIVNQYCPPLKSRVEQVADAIKKANANDVNTSDGKLTNEAFKKEQITIGFKVTSECRIPEANGISKRPESQKTPTVR